MNGPNQDGGPFVASDHPSVSGRERQLRHLADGVRRLIAFAATNIAPADETARAAADIAALATELEARVPSPVPPRLHLEPGTTNGNPYDLVYGLYNPVSVPVVMTDEPPYAVGKAVFGPVHEGPPGRVHGAVLAASFDMVLNRANRLAGPTGPTVRLQVFFERATRVGRPVRFEARQMSHEGRRISTEGVLRQDGEVTCRAAGTFVRIERQDLGRLGRDGDRRG